MILVVRHSDKVRERGYHGAFGGENLTQYWYELCTDQCSYAAGWQLLGWIFLRSLPSSAGRGLKYSAAVVVASWPSTHPLNIAWMTENTGYENEHPCDLLYPNSISVEYWEAHSRFRPDNWSMYVALFM